MDTWRGPKRIDFTDPVCSPIENLSLSDGPREPDRFKFGTVRLGQFLNTAELDFKQNPFHEDRRRVKTTFVFLGGGGRQLARVNRRKKQDVGRSETKMAALAPAPRDCTPKLPLPTILDNLRAATGRTVKRSSSVWG